jgi:hypothetical protein
MTNMKDANLEKSLVDCETKELTNSINIDPVPQRCADDGWPSQKRVAERPSTDWKLKPTRRKLGVGQSGICDPIMTGQILNDLDTPNREVVYRYTRALRGADEAMLDLFRNTVVLDEEGKSHIVPILWASQEKAVNAILQDNVRKDNSLVVDRIRLPIMAIWANQLTLDQTRFTYQKAISLMEWLDPDGVAGFTLQEKFQKDTIFGVTRGLPININYTLYVWTLYIEDMNQIVEQVMLKFSPVAYIRVRGVWWEVIVTMDGTANNLDIEPGDAKLRVIKYQFNMTAKTYIPQPITRLKPPLPNPCVSPCENIEEESPLANLPPEEFERTLKEIEKQVKNLKQWEV